jgi:hypothetical protein
VRFPDVSTLLITPLPGAKNWQPSASVDMTSDVKSWQQIFLGLHHVFHLGALEEPEPAICDG